MSSDAMYQSTKAGWTIKEWDPSQGRGVITSQQLGDITFDGSVATVSDLVTGELVHVTLHRVDNEYRVVSLWPDDPRFSRSPSPHLDAPALQAGLLKHLEVDISRMPVALDYRIATLASDLLVEGDNDNFCYNHEVELYFQAVTYIELPAYWGGKSFRPANAVERSYLASRCDLSETSVAMRIVDDENRIFFVVCGNFRWTRPKTVGNASVR